MESRWTLPVVAWISSILPDHSHIDNATHRRVHRYSILCLLSDVKKFTTSLRGVLRNTFWKKHGNPFLLALWTNLDSFARKVFDLLENIVDIVFFTFTEHITSNNFLISDNDYEMCEVSPRSTYPGQQTATMPALK